MSPRHIMLFQYGSNMDPGRLNSAERLNGIAEVVGLVRLKGWGVRFDLYSESNGCGVTDMIPSAGEHVLGVLYRVPYRAVVAPRGQRSRMDEIEGAGLGTRSNYNRIKISVMDNRHHKTKARTYVGTAAGRKRFLEQSDEEQQVSNEYFGHILAGAQRFRFPASYLAYLRKQAREIR